MVQIPQKLLLQVATSFLVCLTNIADQKGDPIDVLKMEYAKVVFKNRICVRALKATALSFFVGSSSERGLVDVFDMGERASIYSAWFSRMSFLRFLILTTSRVSDTIIQK